MKGKMNRNLSRNRIWYLGAVVLLILTIVLGYYVINIEEEDTDLSVEEVYFASEELGGADTDLKIIVFLTNNGRTDIQNVKVRAFVIESDSNLARDEDLAFFGRIGGKTTLEGELHISVPNNDSYRIELLVFEESKLSIRGSGSIDLKGVGVVTDYSDITNDESGLSYGWGADAVSEDASSLFFTGLCVLILPIGIIIIVIVVIVKQSGKIREPMDAVSMNVDEKDPQAQRAKPLNSIRTFDEGVEEKESVEENEK